jgi:hypothetical protein
LALGKLPNGNAVMGCKEALAGRRAGQPQRL